VYTCPPVKTLSSKRPDIIKFSPKLLADRALLWIVGLVGYWSERLYDFQVDENDARLEIAEDDGQRKLLIVVARKHYFETVRDYPLGNRRDLVGVLTNEPWRYPFEGHLLLKIERLTEQSHRVTSWVIKQEVLDALRYPPLFLVPESACVGLQGPNEYILLNRLGSLLNVGNSFGSLVSAEGQDNLFWRRLFSEVSDEAGQAPVLSESKSTSILLVGAGKAISSNITGFYAGPKSREVDLKAIIRWLYPTTLVASIYLIFSTGLIASLVTFQDIRINQMSEASEEASQLRKSVREKERILQSLNTSLAGHGDSSYGWDLLLDMAKRGVLITGVRGGLSSFEFFCLHESATEILKLLQSDPRVSNAALSSSVRKEKGKDRFSVSVQITQTDVGLYMQGADASTQFKIEEDLRNKTASSLERSR